MQIGEELFEAQRRDSGSKIYCLSNDQDLFWPLFCYKFSLSVEQEDRFLQSHKVVFQFYCLREFSLQGPA